MILTGASPFRRQGAVVVVTLACCVAWTAAPARAANKPADAKAKKKEKDTGPTADELLGDFGAKPKKGAGKAALSDLDSAISPVKPQAAPQDDLAPKSTVLTDVKAPLKVGRVFAAAKVTMGAHGCLEPKGPTAVKHVDAQDFPFKINPFSVCAKLESNRNRSVPVTFKIVSPKGRVVGSSDEVVDFTGHPIIDYVVDFGQLALPGPGQYTYRVEAEGVVMGQQPLYEVKHIAGAKAQEEGTVTTVDEGVNIGIE